MKPFRQWYEDRFKVPYPGEVGEPFHVVQKRMADGLADYADAVFASRWRPQDTSEPPRS